MQKNENATESQMIIIPYSQAHTQARNRQERRAAKHKKKKDLVQKGVFQVLGGRERGCVPRAK